MKTVILDTNFLLIPHQFRINILEELERLLEEAHELAVSSPIIGELKGIAKDRGKAGIGARIALEAIKRNKIRIIEAKERDADLWILDYCAGHPGTIVCTNDANLRKLLKGKTDARLIVMRTRTKIFWA